MTYDISYIFCIMLIPDSRCYGKLKLPKCNDKSHIYKTFYVYKYMYMCVYTCPYKMIYV
jgi:hypothetical protein